MHFALDMICRNARRGRTPARVAAALFRLLHHARHVRTDDLEMALTFATAVDLGRATAADVEKAVVVALFWAHYDRRAAAA